jgi:pimeloyl-ACP methyl ester carboxylesterase
MAIATATPAIAQVQPFPAGFSTRDIATNGAVIHVRVGGKGPPVVLLHGFGDTGHDTGTVAVIGQPEVQSGADPAQGFTDATTRDDRVGAVIAAVRPFLAG